MKHEITRTIVAPVLAAILILTGACARESSPPAREDQGGDKVDIAHASQPPIRLGLIPEQNIFTQKERYTSLLQVVSRRIGRPVELKILTSYDKVLYAFARGEVDGAFIGSFTAATVTAFFDARALVVQVRPDGATSYRGVIIAHRESNISPELSSWRGRSMALVHPHTSAGYLFPKNLLKDAGHDGFEPYLGQVTLMGSHDAVVLEVFEKRADLGALKDTVLQRSFVARPELEADLTVLQTSEPFPATSLVVSENMPAKLAEQIREVMLNMHLSEEGRSALSKTGILRFDRTSRERYLPLRKMIHQQLPTDALVEGALP